MSDLNDAIQLIRQGQKQAAQKVLEPLLKADPTNIPAWFWYVDTCTTVEKRIQVLEVCLKMNPGNSQVIQALQALHKQTPSQTSFTVSGVESPKPTVPQAHTTYSPPYEEPKGNISSPYTPTTVDDQRVHPPSGAGKFQQPSSKQKKAWEENMDAYVDTSLLSKPKPVAKSYRFYEAWMMVLTTFDIESYKNVLDDPEAGAGRAFEWVAYAGIISGIISPLTLISNPQFTKLINMPEFKGLLGTMSTAALMVILALVLAVLTPIMSVILLAISGAIQNMMALMFGGNGYYGRTVYAIAAYLAPMTILVSLLGMIPLAGQCLTSLLGLYNIILTIRALRAAHSISVWQAIGAMLAPGILMLVLGCILIFAVGLPNVSR